MVDTSLLSRLAAEADTDGVQQLVVGAVVQHDGKVEEGGALDAALIREVKRQEEPPIQLRRRGRRGPTDQATGA